MVTPEDLGMTLVGLISMENAIPIFFLIKYKIELHCSSQSLLSRHEYDMEQIRHFKVTTQGRQKSYFGLYLHCFIILALTRWTISSAYQILPQREASLVTTFKLPIVRCPLQQNLYCRKYKLKTMAKVSYRKHPHCEARKKPPTG